MFGFGATASAILFTVSAICGVGEAAELAGLDLKLVTCVTGKGNIEFFKNLPPFDSSFAFIDAGLYNEYDVLVDGRRVGLPSRGTWKIKSGVPHTIETANGPYYQSIQAMVTTERELNRAIAPCVPIKTPDNVGDDYIDARNFYYDNWAELPSCPIESKFKTDGYVRANYYFNGTGDSYQPYGDNTTCTVFQTDSTSRVILDITITFGAFDSNITFAYGNVTLQSVDDCKPLLGTCTASDGCCLGYACIKNKASNVAGKCRACKQSAQSCVSADACCDGLKCGTAGKCVAV